MRTARFLISLSCLFIFAMLDTLTVAQTATTSLTVTVTDQRGAVLPSANLTLANPATGFSRAAKTDSQGNFQFVQIPPATYTLSVGATGFATVKEDNLHLLVNTPATLNIAMQVRAEGTTIEVTGEAPLVNTTDASIGNAFGTRQIASLPFEGRDPVAVLSLQPGVVYVGASNKIDQNFDSRGGAVNGARSDQTNVTLDGVDNNNQTLGYAFQGALRSTLDSLQEFRVTTSNYNADSGRSSGAQVSLITKSGTNSLHGSLYEYHRPTFTTANDWFNKHAQLAANEPNIPGKLLRNTFGGTFGGPIKKDRLFFFAAYEGQRTRENFQVTRIVPSATLRQGVVRYVDVDGNVQTLQPADLAAMDPVCSTPAPGFSTGTCPLGPGPNPAVMAIFQQYPLPNTTAVGDGLNYGGFTFTAPAPGKLDTYVAKLDFNLTQNGNHRAFVRGGLMNDHAVEKKENISQTGDSGPEFPGMPPNQVGTVNSKGLIAGYTAALSNTLINNFRYGFIRQGTGVSGLKTSHFVHFRGLDNPEGFTLTTTGYIPVHNFADDITKIKGSHTLGFGANYRRINNVRKSNSTSFTTATTNVSWLDNAAIAGTGSSLDPAAFGFPAVADSFSNSYDSPVAALVGIVTEVDAQYNITKEATAQAEGSFVPRHFRDNEWEFYAQDAWRAKPNLVLTFGLRYSLLQPPYEATGTQVAPSVSLNDWFRQRGQAMNAGTTFHPTVSFDLSGKANGGQPYWDWDYKDIAPRFAFAFSPAPEGGWLKRLFGESGRSSIRGGFGMYYDHFGQAITNTFDRNGSFGLSTVITNPAAIQSLDRGARFNDLFTIPTASASCAAPPCQILAPPPVGGFPVTPPTTLDAGGFAITWGLDNKLKTPYAEIVDLSFTRELPGGFTLETAYVGRFAHRLLQEDDLAMPLNLRDQKSGMDYFTAATLLTKNFNAGTPIQNMPGIPFWENFYPTAAGPASTQAAGCAPGVTPGTLTATQAMYDIYSCFPGNETTALFVIDLPGNGGVGPGGCFPACATLNGVTQPNVFFDPQWSSLYSWRSIGNSNYHAGQVMLRHRMSHGLQWDFNYTFSKSIDIGSNAERISLFEGFGLGSQIINAWDPDALRAVSDYDAHHQINSNWVYELPFGRGRPFGDGASGILNGLFGGWEVSGLWRWSSGYPFSISPGLGFWPTNWELTSSAILKGKPPQTGTFFEPNSGDPNAFKDFGEAVNAFRVAFPGESGQRNNLRGPGIFQVDLGLGKSWRITESQALSFRAEAFNLTNTPRFDSATMAFTNGSLDNSTNFGKFIQTANDKRVMQFALRYVF